MSRPPSVTYEEVVRAIYKLLQKSQNPTLTSIHELVGNKGSRSTIQKYKTKWMEELGEIDVVNLLPATVPKTLMPLLDELWGHAIDEAGKAHAEDKRAFEAMATNAYKVRDDAIESLESQQAELQDLKHAKTRLEDQVIILKDSLASMERKEADLQARLDAANHRNTDLEDARAADRLRYDQLLENDKAEHQRQLEHLEQQVRDANAVKEKEIERSDRENDYFKRLVAQERDALAAAKQEHANALLFVTKQLDARSVQLSNMEQRLDRQSDEHAREREGLVKRWEEAQAKNSELVQAVAAAEDRASTAEARFSELEADVAQLRLQLANAESSNKDER